MALAAIILSEHTPPIRGLPTGLRGEVRLVRLLLWSRLTAVAVSSTAWVGGRRGRP